MPWMLLTNKWLLGGVAIAGLCLAVWVQTLRLDAVKNAWAAERADAAKKAADEGAKLQFGVDQTAIQSAGTTAVEQEKIAAKFKIITREIHTYVQDTSGCVTVGLVRVLDAAARGDDPATLALAPGEFNETCADVTASALARHITDNYERAHANAAQLTGLQGYVCGVRKNLRPDAPPIEGCR